VKLAVHDAKFVGDFVPVQDFDGNDERILQQIAVWTEGKKEKSILYQYENEDSLLIGFRKSYIVIAGLQLYHWVLRFLPIFFFSKMDRYEISTYVYSAHIHPKNAHGARGIYPNV
jgi:hypothetical protein